MSRQENCISIDHVLERMYSDISIEELKSSEWLAEHFQTRESVWQEHLSDIATCNLSVPRINPFDVVPFQENPLKMREGFFRGNPAGCIPVDEMVPEGELPHPPGNSFGNKSIFMDWKPNDLTLLTLRVRQNVGLAGSVIHALEPTKAELSTYRNRHIVRYNNTNYSVYLNSNDRHPFGDFRLHAMNQDVVKWRIERYRELRALPVLPDTAAVFHFPKRKPVYHHTRFYKPSHKLQSLFR